MNSFHKKSLFTKLTIIVPAITVVFWVFLCFIAGHALRKNIEREFTSANARILNSIAQQSANDLRFYDFYQLRRTLHDFYDGSYMDYFALYTEDLKPFASYPATQLASGDIDFIEKKVAENSKDEKVYQFFETAGDRRFHFQQQVKDESGQVLGFLFMGGRTKWLDSIVREQVLYFIVIGFIVLLLEISVLIYFAKRFTRPINQLTNMLSKAQKSGPVELIPTVLAQPELDKTCHEVEVFDSVVRKLLMLLKEYQEKEMQLSVQATIGRLTSHFAHDIRSPITNISHYLASHAPPKDAPSEEIERFNTAKKNLNKINSMADELTTYTKAKEIRRTVFLIKGMLDEVKKDHLDLANIKNIEISVNADAHSKASLDLDKMTRVLNNMVLNSIQAISKDGGKISVSASINGDTLNISVKDNGCGISQEHLNRVFDSSFTYGKIKGTGLGLAYCKNVVEAHGGTITVESKVNEGTEFRICLPGCISTQQATEEGERAGSKYKISCSDQWLIVDDTKTIREQWRDIMIRAKLPPPVEMSSGEEVHRSGLDFSKFHGAIVDYIFEGSNITGLDIIEFLRHKGLKRIHLCTGNYNEEKVKKEAARLQVASIIPKPIPDDVFGPRSEIFRPS